MARGSYNQWNGWRGWERHWLWSLLAPMTIPWEAPCRAERGRRACTDFYSPVSLAGHDPKHQAPHRQPEQQPLGRQMICVSSPRHQESLDLLNSKVFPHLNVSETRMCLTTDVIGQMTN